MHDEKPWCFSIFVFLHHKINNMGFEIIEYHLVLIGWVTGYMLGAFLLFFKPPSVSSYASYRKGKNTLALAFLVLSAELNFQWLIRFYLKLQDPALSVSVYLFAYCVAALLLSLGFCSVLAPRKIDYRQRLIAVLTALTYGILLTTNFFIENRRLQTIGILVCCALLLVIMCASLYKLVKIYRSAINMVRIYYSDVVESLMRWMPGVGVGLTILLLSAPITCIAPRWVGVNQLVLGIIVFVYTFVCSINFSFSYDKVIHAINKTDEDAQTAECKSPEADAQHAGCSLSASLQEVLQAKEERWRELGGYRSPGVTIDEAAHEMGTNRSYLSRYLNEVRHMTFYAWVAQLRISEACEILLNDRNASIEQIAAQVGFTSLSTFSSTFKRVMGESPVKWRNNQ